MNSKQGSATAPPLEEQLPDFWDKVVVFLTSCREHDYGIRVVLIRPRFEVQGGRLFVLGARAFCLSCN